MAIILVRFLTTYVKDPVHITVTVLVLDYKTNMLD